MKQMLKVTFINVGYGDSILLEYSESQNGNLVMLIDGGSAEEAEFASGTGCIRAADFLKNRGIRSIDILICTHIHEDHTCGLERIAAECEIKEFWYQAVLPERARGMLLDPGVGKSESNNKFIRALNSYSRLWQLFMSKGIPMRQLSFPIKKLELSPDLSVDVLGPTKQMAEWLTINLRNMYKAYDTAEFAGRLEQLDEMMNQTSLALRFNYAGKSILLASDVNAPGFHHLGTHRELLRAQVLKVAHHGQNDSLSNALIGDILPSIVVTCASADRRYQSSDPSIYEHVRNIMRHSGVDPIFLFTDSVNVPPYNTEMRPREGICIDIDEHGGIRWKYLLN